MLTSKRAAISAFLVVLGCAAAAWQGQPRPAQPAKPKPASGRNQFPTPPGMTAVSDIANTSGTIALTGPGVTLTFERQGARLSLAQYQRAGHAALLYKDHEGSQPGAGPVGNPLAVVVQKGKYKGVYGMNTFRLNHLMTGERRLLAYLQQESMPMLVALDITADGNVTHWMGQVYWNGTEPLEADIYFPLLSRVRFDSNDRDRAIFAQTSGSVREPIGAINYTNTYTGRLSSPTFLVEGGGRGLAVVDDNRSDYAPDPGAACRRNHVVANTFPIPETAATVLANNGITQKGGNDGPYVGVRHTRVFRPIGEFGGEETYWKAESQGPAYMQKFGDSVDLGPVRMYAYTGNWKAGALWLRGQRQWVPMRVSKAKWYQGTTFLSQQGEGRSFLDVAQGFAANRASGSDFWFVNAGAESEFLGFSGQPRGDYFFANESRGGPVDARLGVESAQRAGGHLMYYIEGMIIWKRSRIGSTERARDWALMDEDGKYTEHYRGFWHACPANEDYQNWLAETLAELVRTRGVNGFFIDSTLATYNHRCFNPAHKHPHPDVWNWGVRRLLRKVREELDKVDPESVVLLEGCGDIGREFIDGFLSHGHGWTNLTFTEPFLRFLHPDLRAFESWGSEGGAEVYQKLHIWNAVNGHRIFAHGAANRELAPYSLKTRQYYDVYPEITDNQMSVLDVKCENCISQMYEGTYPVITVGNATHQAAEATITIPVDAALLRDRVNGARFPINAGRVSLKLEPLDFRAFELRP